jgi:hypothetical protein
MSGVCASSSVCAGVNHTCVSARGGAAAFVGSRGPKINRHTLWLARASRRAGARGPIKRAQPIYQMLSARCGVVRRERMRAALAHSINHALYRLRLEFMPRAHSDILFMHIHARQ